MPKILIIEDQAILSQLYKTVLERHGYDVVLAATGEAGIEAALQTSPDLVILDLVLPGMSGAQVARSLREDGILKKAPLIVTTGLGEEDAAQTVGSLGISQLLTKPFDIDSMLTAIKSALPATSQPTSSP